VTQTTAPIEKVQRQGSKKQAVANSEDEDGEIGEFGEEITDMNDVPIERPKCLSHINFNTNLSEKQSSTSTTH
jgi:hypothetical protein